MLKFRKNGNAYVQLSHSISCLMEEFITHGQVSSREACVAACVATAISSDSHHNQGSTFLTSPRQASTQGTLIRMTRYTYFPGFALALLPKRPPSLLLLLLPNAQGITLLASQQKMRCRQLTLCLSVAHLDLQTCGALCFARNASPVAAIKMNDDLCRST